MPLSSVSPQQVCRLSIALMGLAASFIAGVLQRRRWIAYVGLAVILYVACEMIYRGALEMGPMLSNSESRENALGGPCAGTAEGAHYQLFMASMIILTRTSPPARTR